MAHRIKAPSAGRDLANPQGVEVNYSASQERVVVDFRDLETGRNSRFTGTPAFARHLAYLLVLHAEMLDGRLISSDDTGFTVRDREAAVVV